MLPLSLSDAFPPTSTSTPRPPIRVFEVNTGPSGLAVAIVIVSSLSRPLTLMLVTPEDEHIATPLTRSQSWPPVPIGVASSSVNV